jgi:spore maturation protein CgeB
MTTVARYYPTRGEIVGEVSKMPNSVAIGGEGYHKERAYNDDYVDILSRSKIVVNSTSLREGDMKLLNPRFFEAAACGALLLTEPADDMELVGFEPGENCEIFESIKEMKGKAAWYMLNPRERRRVAKNGQKLVRENHSCKVRVGQLTDMIERIL